MPVKNVKFQFYLTGHRIAQYVCVRVRVKERERKRERDLVI